MVQLCVPQTHPMSRPRSQRGSLSIRGEFWYGRFRDDQSRNGTIVRVNRRVRIGPISLDRDSAQQKLLAMIPQPLPKPRRKTKRLPRSISIIADKHRPHPGWIYVLQTKYRAFKIGQSTRPNDRMACLRILLPYKVRTLRVEWTEDTNWAERHIHTVFAHKRLNGEWFRLNSRQLRRLMELPDFTRATLENKLKIWPKSQAYRRVMKSQ